MPEHDVDDVKAGWSILRRAGEARSAELQSLAAQMADLLDRAPTVGSTIARIAAGTKVVGNLGLLAEAAPPLRAGAIHRLWGLAQFYRDELDEIEWESRYDDEDFDELPA